MPVNNILGSGSSSPIDLYKVSQSTSQSPGADSQKAESTQRANEKKESFSVKISQEAIELQKRERTKQAEFEQELQKNREVREQTDTDIQKQRVETRERAEQQSIDVIV